MKKSLAILLLVALFVGSALQAEDVAKPALRTWKDSTGQFSIEATFVRVTGDKVVLQGSDKKEISVPLAKLSVADQQYVKTQLTPDSNAKKTITNTIGMKLNRIPAGTFMMGSPESETGRYRNEHQHKVTISKAFYIQTTEVTQAQWKAVMGTEPWENKSGNPALDVKEGANYPATRISWNDAFTYSKKLSEKEGKTYRLPTEAEWEYACRAGTKTAWSFGNDEKALGDYAWYYKNTERFDRKEYARQVGLKKPNAFGLYDMHGNVWEWCYDYFETDNGGLDYYKQSPEKDPRGPKREIFVRGERREEESRTLAVQDALKPGIDSVARGGAHHRFPAKTARNTRSAFRTGFSATSPARACGFRVVRELD